MRQRDDTADADDVFPFIRMIEEAEVADLHGAHIIARLIVAYASPGFALRSSGHEVIPRKRIGLRFQ